MTSFKLIGYFNTIHIASVKSTLNGFIDAIYFVCYVNIFFHDVSVIVYVDFFGNEFSSTCYYCIS